MLFRSEAKLAAFEQRKGSQVAVLLVPATAPETIEQFGIRVAEKWKLGRKGVDDGAILIVAKEERKLRIEVGRGLEGVLPDAVAKRIIADDIVPRFKQGDFNAGVNAGVDRMIKVIDGEPLPAPKASGWESAASDDALGWGALLVVFFGGLLRSIFGAFFGSLIAGGIAAGVAIFLGLEMAASLIVGAITKSSRSANGFSAEAQGRTQVVRSNVQPRNMIYGRAMTSGPLVFAASKIGRAHV